MCLLLQGTKKKKKKGKERKGNAAFRGGLCCGDIFRRKKGNFLPAAGQRGKSQAVQLGRSRAQPGTSPWGTGHGEAEVLTGRKGRKWAVLTQPRQGMLDEVYERIFPQTSPPSAPG